MLVTFHILPSSISLLLLNVINRLELHRSHDQINRSGQIFNEKKETLEGTCYRRVQMLNCSGKYSATEWERHIMGIDRIKIRKKKYNNKRAYYEQPGRKS